MGSYCIQDGSPNRQLSTFCLARLSPPESVPRLRPHTFENSAIFLEDDMATLESGRLGIWWKLGGVLVAVVGLSLMSVGLVLRPVEELTAGGAAGNATLSGWGISSTSARVKVPARTPWSDSGIAISIGGGVTISANGVACDDHPPTLFTVPSAASGRRQIYHVRASPGDWLPFAFTGSLVAHW